MIKGVSLSVTGKVGTLMKIKHPTNGQCSPKHMDQMFAESSRLDVFVYLGNARCIFYHINLWLNHTGLLRDRNQDRDGDQHNRKQ